jgi:hypothetical protein
LIEKFELVSLQAETEVRFQLEQRYGSGVHDLIEDNELFAILLRVIHRYVRVAQ